MVVPGWLRTRKKGHWEAGDKAVRRRGGRGSVGVARCLTIFASRLRSRPKASAVEGTMDNHLQKMDFCQPLSSLTQNWRSGPRMERRRLRLRLTAWTPADRGQSSHCHLRMPSLHQRSSVLSLGNGTVS